MPNLSRIFVILVLSFNSSASFAPPIRRPSQDSKSLRGSISGRVTLNANPAKGILIILTRDAFDGEDKPVARSTTDQDGRFRIGNVPAGSFNLSAFAPALVADAEFGRNGKRVTISPGEILEGVEISLKRGGVITGKVSDSAGQPIIEETVALTMIDEHGKPRAGFEPMSWQSSRTDDRGFYRIFGVPEGRYIVSVGEPPNQRSPSAGRGNAYYPITFHPGVGDESKATVIELAAGAESTGVDIVLGREDKTYTVRGRIVSAETGKPVPDIRYGYAVLYEGSGLGTIGGIDFRSDPQGNFRLDNVIPNKYAAFVVKESESEYYSDLLPFDVNDADVSGLDIKVRRGVSISGVAVINGSPDGAAVAKLSGLRIRAFVQSTEPVAPSFGSSSNIALDGGFRISGIQPGKVKLSLAACPPPKGYALTRVERDGVESPDGSFEISAGEQLSGVRVTIAYGSGVIRGQLKTTSTTSPLGARFRVRLKRAGVEFGRPDWSTEADDRNRFLFEDLPPGDYELTVQGYIDVPGAPASRLPEVTRRVAVTNDSDAEVTIILDAGVKDK